MSNYTAIEQAIEALLLTYSGGTVFTTSLNNTSRGDYRVMDAVGTDAAAVVVQAAESDYGYTGPGARGTHGKETAVHRPAVDLFVKRSTGLGGDGIAYAALLSLRDGVVNHLRAYPRLNNTANVLQSRIVSVTRPIILRDRPHAYSRVTLEVIEQYPLGWQEASR